MTALGLFTGGGNLLLEMRPIRHFKAAVHKLRLLKIQYKRTNNQFAKAHMLTKTDL